MFDLQKFMTFINDPMSAHKAADLPVDPRALMQSLSVGLKAPNGQPELGLKAPAEGAPPSGLGLDVSKIGFGDIQSMAKPTVDWAKLGMAGASMMGQQAPKPQLTPPAHQFVGGPRQVKLNPYLTVPGKQ